jgi:hypothetical protein
VSEKKQQILALCPADNWYAVYRDVQGLPYASRVTVWAVVRKSYGADGTVESVCGIEMGGVGRSGMPAGNDDSFLCYLHEKDLGGMPISADTEAVDTMLETFKPKEPTP